MKRSDLGFQITARYIQNYDCVRNLNRGSTSFEFEDGDLGRHANSSGITQVTEPAVNIQVLASLLVKASPLLVNILRRAPLNAPDLHTELESVCMAGEC